MKAFSFGGKKPTAKKPVPVAAFGENEAKPHKSAGTASESSGINQPKPAPLPAAEPDDDVDPLDAFMATNEKKGAEERAKKAAAAAAKPAVDRFEEEEDDPETAYYIAREKKEAEMALQSGQRKSAADMAAEVTMGDSDADSDDEVYGTARMIRDAERAANVVPSLKTAIEELSGVDHSKIEYNAFEKCFYEEDPEIFAMSESEVMQLRRQLDLRVQGEDPPRPIRSFENLHLPATVSKDVAKHGYTTPTPIQAQALPAALLGRDVLGIAKTGSGKTAAFLLPMMVHILDQDFLAEKEGPIGLVMSPTRELSQQIFVEAKKFSKSSEIHVAGCYGGASKNEQRLDLLKGAEVVIATPGRFIDMVKSKATNCARVTFLVLDEADRMLDMGFETQIRCVMELVRPERQTLLFSATFKKRIRELTDTLLDEPVHIIVGSIGEASADVHQVVKVLADETGKWPWMMEVLPAMVDDGEVIVFVSTKVAAEELATNLVKFNFRAAALHGDKQQRDRDTIFADFKKGKVQVLVATDVAARGLDVPSIRNVICFDPSRDKDSHTHRIGRTGRAGEKGCAYSLVTHAQPDTAAFLVRSLMEVGQAVPENLLRLAEQDGQFNQRAPGGGRGAGRGRGRGRGGFASFGGVGAGGGGGGGRQGGGRGRGGGFGVGYKAEMGGAVHSGEERMAGLGLASARGTGAVLAKNRLINDFKNSFEKGGIQATAIEGGVHASPGAAGGAGNSSAVPLPRSGLPPPAGSFPPPPPSGSFPPPPPGAPAGRGRGMTEPAWKANAAAAAGGGGGAGAGGSSGDSDIDSMLQAAAAAVAQGQEGGAGCEGGGDAKRRKTRWDR